jgi:hypothetical protein
VVILSPISMGRAAQRDSGRIVILARRAGVDERHGLLAPFSVAVGKRPRVKGALVEVGMPCLGSRTGVCCRPWSLGEVGIDMIAGPAIAIVEIVGRRALGRRAKALK